MDNIISVNQMPAFRKAFKKLHQSRQELVKNAIKEIISNPEIVTMLLKKVSSGH
jgi:hypothetical protein